VYFFATDKSTSKLFKYDVIQFQTNVISCITFLAHTGRTISLSPNELFR